MSIIISIIVAVLVGFIVLVLEYKTGWFQARQASLDALPRISGFARKCLPLLRRLLAVVLRLLGITLGSSLIATSAFFLTPEARDHPELLFVLLALFVGVGFCLGFFTKPNYVLSVLCAINAIAAAILIPLKAEGRLQSSIPLPASLSPPDFDEPRTLTLFAVTVSLAAVWVASVAIWKQMQTRFSRIRDDLVMLYDIPDIKRSIKETERLLLNAIRDEWKQFQKQFAKRRFPFVNGQFLFVNGEVIFHCVPIGVRKRTIILGFRSERDYRAFAHDDPRIPYRWSLQGKAEKHLRSYFRKPYLRVTCKMVSPETFEEASKF